MSNPSEVIDFYVGTTTEPGSVFEENILKEDADRCMDCGYWTLLTLMEDGYCYHCWEGDTVEDEW